MGRYINLNPSLELSHESPTLFSGFRFSDPHFGEAGGLFFLIFPFPDARSSSVFRSWLPVVTPETSPQPP